jgi:enoyl-CoA hydratase/carnithine racemase
MAEQLIGTTVENRIARLTLQRPAAGNAFTAAMREQFLAALQSAARDADILVLSATGSDFSLGLDRQEPRGTGGPFTTFKLVTDINTALSGFPGIVVAVVRGRAHGFGVGLVMRADIAIAGESASLALDEVKLGIAPMLIMSEIIEHLPPKIAADAILTSREFSAAEACKLGLVSRVVPDDRLADASEALVQELRARDPAVLRQSKRYMRTVSTVPYTERGNYALAEQTRFALQNH